MLVRRPDRNASQVYNKCKDMMCSRFLLVFV